MLIDASDWRSYNNKSNLGSLYIKTIENEEHFLWIGTAQGLVRYDKDKDKYRLFTTKDGLTDNFITSIAISSDEIWIGTAMGLNLLDRKTMEFTHFTKDNGLTDNYITDIKINNYYIWVATQLWGINLFDRKLNKWKSYTIIDGLADNSITALAIDDTTIWAATYQGLSYFDKTFNMWLSYGADQGISKLRINSITIDGPYIWCGSEGGGAYKFDRYEEKFTIFDSENTGIADDFIKAIMSDGNLIWIGSFGGVTVLNKMDNTIKNYKTSSGLVEDSVSSIAIDGNYIWFGTDGGGISRFNKKYPQVFISARTRYEKENFVKIYGTIFDQTGIKSANILYQSAVFQGKWSNKGIKINKGNIIDSELAEWDVTGLIDGPYDIQLIVENKSGIKNQYYYPFSIDTVPPQIELTPLPEATSEAGIKIRGTYQDMYMEEIYVADPWNKKAEVFPDLKRFSCYIDLKEGVNNIKVIIVDRGKHRVPVTARVILDKQPPNIKITLPDTVYKSVLKIKGIINDQLLDKVIIDPGKIIASFNKIDDFQYEISEDIRLEQGINKVSIQAYDKADHESKLEKDIFYKSSYPSIVIKSLPDIVTNKRFRIEGTYTGDLKRLTSVPKELEAKINTKDKTFYIVVNLVPAINLITITAENSIGNTINEIVQVFYKKAQIPLIVNNIPKETSDGILTITGKISKKVDKVILEPGDILCQINNNTFSGDIFLNKGKNTIDIIAYSRGKIIHRVSSLVKFKPDRNSIVFSTDLQKKLENCNRLSIEVNQLRKQVALLNQQIEEYKNRAPIRKKTVFALSKKDRIYIPKGKALYFVPYDIAKGDSVYSISKKYLGSQYRYTDIVKFNDDIDFNMIKKRKKILVPTLSLLKDIESSDNRLFTGQILDIAAASYNTLGSGADIGAYRKEFLKRLTIAGILKFNKRFVSSGSIDVGNYILKMAYGRKISTATDELHYDMKRYDKKNGIYLLINKNELRYMRIELN